MNEQKLSKSFRYQTEMETEHKMAIATTGFYIFAIIVA